MLGTLKHRFRGRLMIPIRDHQGRVVAFTARQTDLTPADDPAREAKYVNSPETPIFTKGNLLFNLDRARSHVGDDRPFVLVEGQLDALRCWQVGLKTAVAPQGTAITDTQLVLLRRYHPQVECFFDSDSAGQKAALRFLPMALKAGLEVRFLTLAGAEKVDPDLLFLERGLAAYDEIAPQRPRHDGFACSGTFCPTRGRRRRKPHRGPSSRFMRSLTASGLGGACSGSFWPKSRRRQCALLTPDASCNGTSCRFIRRQEPPEPGAPPPRPAGAAPPPPTGRPPEHDLLLLCLHYEQFGKPLAHELLPRDWIDAAHPAGVLLRRFLTEFEHDAWPGRDHLDELLETPEEKTLVASLLFEAPDHRRSAQGRQRGPAPPADPRARAAPAPDRT